MSRTENKETRGSHLP